jgi:GMP synthase-like glutamine amidotransferase
VNVLALVHGDDGPPGSFADVIAERGHALDTWAIAREPAPPQPIDDYGAVLLLGGAMHADQEADHPWLRHEDELIRRLLDRRMPVLGVCLGGQLLAKAVGARVGPAAAPEIGWHEVELVDGDDPVLGVLPPRFPAFQWHFYAFDVPPGGHELARSAVCPQAFRLGDAAWGVQFHPEVTAEIVTRWAELSPEEAPDGLLAETEERIDQWVVLGRALGSAFVRLAERGGVAP